MNNEKSNLLIKNGVAAMIVALFGGFILIWSMIKGISLSPLPFFIDFTIPGTPAGWRTFHLGMLLNGLMAILLGATMRLLVITERGQSIVCWGTVFAIWANCVFYLFGMFAPNHGLTLGTNHVGEGNLAGAIAFLPALIGAVTLIAALIVLFRSRFRD